MSVSIPKSALMLCRRLAAAMLLLLLLAGSGLAQGAIPPGQIALDEDQVARFAASLPDMRAIGARLADTAARELNPDNPLDPFTALAEPGKLADPDLMAALAGHGFASLDEWMSIGRAVMLAYWLNDDTLHNLAARTAQMVIALKGGEQPDPIAYSRLISKLKADMIANATERPLPENARLTKKYRAAIERGLRGVY